MAVDLLEELRKSIVSMDKTESFMKGCIYGPSGVGKTVFTMKLAKRICPPGKKILFIDASEGWVSLKNHKGLTSSVDRMLYLGKSQIEILLKAILDDEEGFNNYGVIVLDEISTMLKVDQRVVLKNHVKKNLKDVDSDMLQWPQYNASTQRFSELLINILNAVNRKGIHILFVSHMRVDKNKANLPVESPSLTASFSETFKEGLHLVGRLSATETRKAASDSDDTRYTWSVQVHPTTGVVAKSRIGGLPVNTTPENLLETITEWLAGNGENEETDREPEQETILIGEKEDDVDGFGGIIVSD